MRQNRCLNHAGGNLGGVDASSPMPLSLRADSAPVCGAVAARRQGTRTVSVPVARTPRHPDAKMSDMNDTPSTSIECGTCVAAGTTACTDCIVTHLLANDDGPVDFVPVALGSPSDTGAAPVDDAPVDSRGHPAAQGHRGGRADPGDRVIELF